MISKGYFNLRKAMLKIKLFYLFIF